jgi:hypothetical protein
VQLTRPEANAILEREKLIRKKIQPLLGDSGSLKTINGSSILGEGDLVVTGGGGVTEHGALTGLADDDHSQYYNQARGDARYSQL